MHFLEFGDLPSNRAIRNHETERQAKQEALNEKKESRKQLEAQLQTSFHMRSQLENSIKKSQEHEYKIRSAFAKLV